MAYLLKINSFLSYLYLVTTAVIIVLLNLNIISYGADATDSIMSIIFLLTGVLVLAFQAMATRAKQKVRVALLLISSFVMAFMTCYYLVEMTW